MRRRAVEAIVGLLHLAVLTVARPAPAAASDDTPISFCLSPAEARGGRAGANDSRALWTGGRLAARVEVGPLVIQEEARRAVARAELTVENLGAGRLVADRLLFQLRAYRRSGVPLGPAELTRLASSSWSVPVIEAGERGSILLSFSLGMAVEADTVGRVELRWGFLHGDGTRSLDYSTFLRCARRPTPRNHPLIPSRPVPKAPAST